MTFASPDQSRLMDRAAPHLRKSPGRENQHFIFLLLDQFTHLAFSCAVEPLRLANHAGERELYSWETCSEDGANVQASNGVKVAVDRSLGTLTARETLVVVGGRTPKNSVSSTLMAQVRRLQAHGVKIISVCGATSVLAAAGVIKNQTCAVHWDISDAFSELHPSVEIVEGAFTLDRIPTAAGGAAAADLMLHLIGQDHGPDLAALVADQMVYTGIRGPQAPQTSSIQARFGLRNRHLAMAMQLMETHLDDPLCMKDVARQIGLSVRQLERLFQRHLNASPNRHYMVLRMTRARKLLSQTELSITDIALACGFTSPSHFSKKYREYFGQSAQQHRTVNAPFGPSSFDLVG